MCTHAFTDVLTTLIILTWEFCRSQNRFPPSHLACLFACLFLHYLSSKQALGPCKVADQCWPRKDKTWFLPSVHDTVGLWWRLIHWLICKLFSLSLGFASSLGHDCSIDLYTRNAPRPTTWQMNWAQLLQWLVVFFQTWHLQKDQLPEIVDSSAQGYFITTSF